MLLFLGSSASALFLAKSIIQCHSMDRLTMAYVTKHNSIDAKKVPLMIFA